jgi:hypothetical protein
MFDFYLTPWQLRWAKDAGFKRTEANDGKMKDRPDYQDHSVLQDDLTANIAACKCELAISLYLNQSWNGAYWLPSEHKIASKAPDVGRNVEVRRVRELGNPLPVKVTEQNSDIFQVWDDKQREDHLVIVGWAPGLYAWKYGEQKWQEKRALDASLLWTLNAYERS